MYAAIDVGSHSTKLYLANREADGRWRRRLEQVVVTELGLGDPARQGLHPDGAHRTLQALEAMAVTCREHGVVDIVAAGTAVLRSARDASAFVLRVHRDTSIPLMVISGEDEARLTYLGAVGGLDACEAEGVDLAFDVGGRSTEVAWGCGPRPDGRVSLDLGTIRLADEHGLHSSTTAEAVAEAGERLDAALSGLPDLPVSVRRLVGIGGTPGSVLAIHLARDIADSLEVHGQELPRPALTTMMSELAAMDTDSRAALPGLHPGRARVILAGAVIVDAVARRWPHAPLLVSATGLGEGLLEARFGTRAGS